MSTKAEETARLTTELASIRAAIKAIEDGGQSVSIGDMSYTEASYSALVAREKSTAAELARVNGSRPRVLPVNFGGMYR